MRVRNKTHRRERHQLACSCSTASAVPTGDDPAVRGGAEESAGADGKGQKASQSAPPNSTDVQQWETLFLTVEKKVPHFLPLLFSRLSLAAYATPLSLIALSSPTGSCTGIAPCHI